MPALLPVTQMRAFAVAALTVISLTGASCLKENQLERQLRGVWSSESGSVLPAGVRTLESEFRFEPEQEGDQGSDNGRGAMRFVVYTDSSTEVQEGVFTFTTSKDRIYFTVNGVDGYSVLVRDRGRNKQQWEWQRPEGMYTLEMKRQ